MRAEASRLAAGGAAAAVFCLGLACEADVGARAFECASLERVAHLAHVHYEEVECDSATQSAESHLSAAYYRKACEQLTPIGGLPNAVTDAYVSACAPGNSEQGGSILQIEICCP